MRPANFFNRNAVAIAKDLIGKFLIKRRKDGKKERFKIIETEAYEGLNDLASHASRGKTPRNTPMFAAPGTIYVYFTYGMHWMFNIVCGRPGHPAAVLIRGITHPQPLSYSKRGGVKPEINLSGPARLTKYLKIDKKLNGKVLGKKTGLWVEDSKIKRLKIERLPRVGVSYAGPVWSKKKWRFLLKTIPTSDKNKLR